MDSSRVLSSFWVPPPCIVAKDLDLLPHIFSCPRGSVGGTAAWLCFALNPWFLLFSGWGELEMQRCLCTPTDLFLPLWDDHMNSGHLFCMCCFPPSCHVECSPLWGGVCVIPCVLF